jgi:iron complex outermembrane recepter protein
MQSRSARTGISTLAQTITAILCAAGAIASMQAHAQAAESETTTEAKSEGEVTELSDLSVTEDPLRALPNEPSGSSFGFAKPLLETPRSVSFVSEEQIRLFGVSTVEDLARVVPGTFTTTRYGLQGGINVRGVSADTYYRGMKRLNQQGHVRTVLSAMDNIEVVKGPPSPLFGMGKIGGYTNLDPRSSRARTGKYLPDASGMFQATTGSYDKSEIQIGTGIPFTVGERAAGLYVFGLLEDSDTYVKHVEAKQRFIQATASVDNVIGPFRVETGGQLQNSITSGAYMNRVTQDLVSNERYIRGNPLVNLDLNADGRIGLVEHGFASPVRGNWSSNNSPLRQRFNNPFVNGAKQAPVVPGIPQTMLDFLNSSEGQRVANCHAADVMRGMPAGGPLPQSGSLPVGFVLNPCTVSIRKADLRGNGAYEREQNGEQKLGYFDLVYDTNPDFTVKSQLFYDNIDSYKDSWLPYGENQYIKTVEEKVTVTKKVPDSWLPGFMSVNSLASVNYRKTSGWILSGGVSGNDYDFRQDIHYDGGFGNGQHYPNTMFWTQLTNDSYATGGPAERYRLSEFDERGAALMFDMNFWSKTNLMIGARYDRSDAEAKDLQPSVHSAGNLIDPATGLTRDISQLGTACTDPIYAPTSATGTAAARARGCPGFLYSAPVAIARATDSGKSWSASISHQLPWGIRPYFTAANSSLTLDASNNIIEPSVVAAGFIGEAFLREVGIKGSFFGGKLQTTIAGFRQSRNDVSSPDDPSAGADVSSSEAEGYEVELKWVPSKDIYVSAYYTFQQAWYTTPIGGSTTFDVNGRQVGFQDVLDPVTGELLYPAEAFLYGGRANAPAPAGSDAFEDRVGNPERQASIQSTWQIGRGFGVLASANWNSAVYANRQKTISLPESYVFNIGATYDVGKVHLKVNGFNISDEVYFRAASGDTSGQLVSVMPGPRWEASIKVDF